MLKGKTPASPARPTTKQRLSAVSRQSSMDRSSPFSNTVCNRYPLGHPVLILARARHYITTRGNWQVLLFSHCLQRTHKQIHRPRGRSSLWAFKNLHYYKLHVIHRSRTNSAQNSMKFYPLAYLSIFFPSSSSTTLRVLVARVLRSGASKLPQRFESFFRQRRLLS